MNPKYIDVNAFIMQLMERHRIVETEWQQAYWAGVDDIIGELVAAHAADVVEVIRCKDCKYSEDSECGLELNKKTPLCECDYSKMINRSNDYCSWGRRKEEEDDNTVCGGDAEQNGD